MNPFVKEKIRLSPYLYFFRYPIQNQSELSERMDDLSAVYNIIYFHIGYIWKDSKDFGFGYHYFPDKKSLEQDLLELIQSENPKKEILGLTTAKIIVEV